MECSSPSLVCRLEFNSEPRCGYGSPILRPGQATLSRLDFQAARHARARTHTRTYIYLIPGLVHGHFDERTPENALPVRDALIKLLDVFDWHSQLEAHTSRLPLDGRAQIPMVKSVADAMNISSKSRLDLSIEKVETQGVDIVLRFLSVCLE